MKKTIIVSLVALMFVGACSKKAENQISKEDVAIASQVPSTNGPPPRSDAVSYTHLDVYKRQM